MDLKLAEYEWISERFEYRPIEDGLQVDLAAGSVSEAEPDDVPSHVASLNDVIVHSVHSRGAIRFKGWLCLASCQFSSHSAV
jgi:hypothetical protein